MFDVSPHFKGYLRKEEYPNASVLRMQSSSSGEDAWQWQFGRSAVGKVDTYTFLLHPLNFGAKGQVVCRSDKWFTAIIRPTALVLKPNCNIQTGVTCTRTASYVPDRHTSKPVHIILISILLIFYFLLIIIY